jgi:hypothetical protein
MCNRSNLFVILIRIISLAAIVTAASITSAAVVVNIDHVAVAPAAQDQTVYLDIFLVDLDNSDERLNGFMIRVLGRRNEPAGVRFAPPVQFPSDAHPYVFNAFQGSGPVEPIASNYREMNVFGGNQVPETEANVTSNLNGLFRIPVLIPAGATPGEYPVAVDPSMIVLSSRRGFVPYTIGPIGGVTVVPEPVTIMFPSVLAGSMLRRRRSA